VNRLPLRHHLEVDSCLHGPHDYDDKQSIRGRAL
jgi:hypothetical protein